MLETDKKAKKENKGKKVDKNQKEDKNKKEEVKQLLPSTYGNIFKNSYTVTMNMYYALGIWCISEDRA